MYSEANKEKKYPIMQIDHSGSELIKNNKKILLKEDPTNGECAGKMKGTLEAHKIRTI